MSDPRVTGPNMEAIRQAARERMAAEQRRLAEEQAKKAAEGAGSVNAAEHAAETARQAPIEEDVFVREASIAQSTEDDRQQIYDRFNTDGEDGLTDGEFEHAFAAASIEGAEISGDRPQPSGSPDRAMEVIEGARNGDRQTLEDAQAALESLPPEARAEYEGQVQALQEAFDQKWTIPDEAMATIGQANIDAELPEPGDQTAEEYEQQLVELAEGDQQTIDNARRALEKVPPHLRDAHATKVQELESQFEAKWETPPAETGPEEAAVPETYTVASGDSLSRIAQEMTGDASRWQELYEANQDVIGGDPNLIHPGQELQIPESWQPQEATVEEAPPVEETTEEPEGGSNDPVTAAIDEAERQVAQPPYTEAMFAGAPAQQRASESEAIGTAQEAIDALPEGADRDAAQTRLDSVRTAYEAKHGSPPEGSGDAPEGGGQPEETGPELVEPRGGRREDTVEDLAKADAAEPGSEAWNKAMQDALKGVDEGDLNEDNRHDLQAIADRYHNHGVESGDEASLQRAEALRLIAENPDFNADAAEKIIHSMQDNDNTTGDLEEVRDQVLEGNNPDEMRAFALANAAANPDDPLEQDYSQALLTASEATSPEVRQALADAMRDLENTGEDFSTALASAQSAEDFAAISAIAGYKETHREGEVAAGTAALTGAIAEEAANLSPASLQALGQAAGNPEDPTGALLTAYANAGTADQREAIMRVAEGFGNAEALQALRNLHGTPADNPDVPAGVQ